MIEAFDRLVGRKAEHRQLYRLNLIHHNELQLGKDGVCRQVLGFASLLRRIQESSYLVDPASSHMLVSKTKPCMSKYKQICTVKLRMAH